PGQPRSVCVCVVELKFGPDKQLAEDTNDKVAPAPAELAPGGALSRAIVTLHVPEDAIDAVRENGSVVLVPRNGGPTMVVAEGNDHDSCRPIPTSGLTLREKMRDNDRGPLPDITDQLPPQPTAVAQSITSRPPRVIAVTQQGQLSLFAGMIKIIFLRP